MGKLIIDGEVASGTTNYAAAVACVDREGNKSTVQAEIDELNTSIDTLKTANATVQSEISELNNSIDTLKTASAFTADGITYIKIGNHVDLYGALSNLGSGTTVTLTSLQFCKPLSHYAVIPLYSITAPYVPVGTMWIGDTGSVAIYKTSATTSGYVSGSYICKD